MEPPWKEETKFYSNGPGHMTKMASTPIYFNFSVIKRPISFRKLSSIYVFSNFPFGFEGRIWDLIVSVPDQCLSFYFAYQSSCGCAVWWP